MIILKLEYDILLFQLEARQINWWEYSRRVPPMYRPTEYTTYWTYLKNKEKKKRFVKEAEWRMEARRKGLLRE